MNEDNRPTVLFVDDEEDLLAALRQTLRKQRKVWNLVFACGAAKALAYMENNKVDVIVADMRMPGMNGAELLSRVHSLYPSTFRFILSGEASDAQAIHAIPYTHQWMSKPCARDVLVGTIELSLNLDSRLSSDRVRRVVGQASGFSSPPDVYQGLLAALQDPAVEMGVVVDWIEQDPSLAARVLQLTNSSFFGLRREIVDLKDATTTIGLRLLADLVLVSGVFAIWSNLTPEVDAEIQKVLDHSRRVASAASIIANNVGVERGAVVTAGLLHDVGWLAMFSTAFDSECGWMTTLDPRDDRDNLEASLGCSHAEIGGAILQAWGLPLVIVEAVVNHVDPTPSTDGQMSVAGAVHLANALVLDQDPSRAYLESVGGSASWDLWKQLVAPEDPEADAA